MHVIRAKLADNKGFTLIEMAIVLIIIGIIIGAVVKGKDVIKSAEQKRLYSTFVREWQVAYNNYYDRTGWILGDDNTTTNTTRDGHCGNGGSLADAATLDSQLSNAGLNPPAAGSTGLSNERTYTDFNGRQYTLTLEFVYNSTSGNHIRISNSTTGVPMDLGLAWDRIIDGTADGNDGDFLFDTNITTTGVNDWPTNIGTRGISTDDGLILKMEF